MIHVDPALILSPSKDAAARALIDRQLAILTRLAEIGMDIAEAAGRAAVSPAEDDHPLRDPALTFARVARAVRLTIALQARLSKDLAALAAAETLAESARANERRARIHRIVERAIEAGCPEHLDGDEIERLSSNAWEKLADAEDADLATCPLDQIVAAICADLGLAPAEYVQPFDAPPPGSPHADPASAQPAPPLILRARHTGVSKDPTEPDS